MTLRHYLYFKITEQTSKIPKIREKGFKESEEKLFRESVFVDTAQSIYSKNIYRSKTEA